MEVSDQLQNLAALPPWKQPQVPTGYGSQWDQSGSEENVCNSTRQFRTRCEFWGIWWSSISYV